MMLSMSFLHQYVDLLVHLDRHLNSVVGHYGSWTYLLIFAIIFCETGLVVTPFLPGDSLLFVLGAMAATGMLQLGLLIAALSLAAFGGNMLNYTIGTLLSHQVLERRALVFINQKNIDRTHAFFEKYGAKTIIITRFVPIIRTFAPFLAGVGGMPYGKFTLYNFIGGTAWVLVGILCGFFFGNLPLVRQNFSLVILVIVAVSLVPAAMEYINHRRGH
jgi:membrane-associated protein